MYAVSGFLRLFARFPMLGGLFGLIVTLGVGRIGLASWTELQTMPDTPPQVSLAQASHLVSSGGETWVDIERVRWDCQNTVYSRIGGSLSTEVLFTDETGSILGVAKFGGAEQCTDLQPTRLKGILSPMSDRFYQRMPERGFHITPYSKATVRVHLCAYCGRNNSIGALICSMVLAPLGLLMYPLSLALRRSYRKKGLL